MSKAIQLFFLSYKSAFKIRTALNDDPKIINLTNLKFGKGSYYTFANFGNKSLAKKAMGKINSVKNVWANFVNDTDYSDPSFEGDVSLVSPAKPASVVSVPALSASTSSHLFPALPAKPASVVSVVSTPPLPPLPALPVKPASVVSVVSAPPLPASPISHAPPVKSTEEIIVETDKLFKVTGKAEMLNYWYVWFKYDVSKNEIIDLPADTDNIIAKYIHSNAFPINHLQKDIYDVDIKKNLLRDEFNTLKKFLLYYPQFKDYNLIQIPRIIYDLISYDYLVDKDPLYRDYFNIDNIKNFDELNRRITEELKKPYFLKSVNEINKLFCTEYIKKEMIPILLDDSANHFPVFLEILDKILLKTTQRYRGTMAKLSETTKNDVGAIITHPRFNIMIKQLLYVECGYIYNFDSASSSYTVNTDKNKFLLFRGEGRLNDSTFFVKDKINNKYPVHSLSYNTSLLSGIFYEVTCHSKGACTYQYYKKDKNKKFYLLDKFMLDDCSIYDKLFHIPPLHPIFNLLGQGELWHPRTKITIDYKVNPYSSSYMVSGLFMYQVPTLLISKIETQEEFDREYQNIIGPAPGKGRRKLLINKNFIKYLYYKSKYLQLKNKLTLHN